MQALCFTAQDNSRGGRSNTYEGLTLLNNHGSSTRSKDTIRNHFPRVIPVDYYNDALEYRPPKSNGA